MGLYWAHIGIMDKNMQTTISSLPLSPLVKALTFRVYGIGLKVYGSSFSSSLWSRD